MDIEGSNKIDIVNERADEVFAYLKHNSIDEDHAAGLMVDLFRNYFATPFDSADFGGRQVGLLQRAYWLSLSQPGAWVGCLKKAANDLSLQQQIIDFDAPAGPRACGPIIPIVPDVGLQEELTQGTVLREGGFYEPSDLIKPKIYASQQGYPMNWYGPLLRTDPDKRCSVEIFRPIFEQHPDLAVNLYEELDNSTDLSDVSRLLSPGMGFWFIGPFIESIPLPSNSPSKSRKRYVDVLFALRQSVEVVLKKLSTGMSDGVILPVCDGEQTDQTIIRRAGHLAEYCHTIMSLIQYKLSFLATGEYSVICTQSIVVRRYLETIRYGFAAS